MELVFHLGDNVEDVEIIEKFLKVPIINVVGNCDFSETVPEEVTYEIQNKKFFLTHGDRYDVKSDYRRLQKKAKEIEADVVLFGHTHKSENFNESGILFMNPGSPSLPRGSYPSIGIITIENGEIDSFLLDV